jgi:N-acyl-D-amino-acid deacylase
MAEHYDLLIRGGTIVDGSGGAPFVADLAVSNGHIAAIGKLDGTAKEVMDAHGLTVTPGFIDIHTHYDGQAVWSKRLNPSSSHGVTTVIMGNCGVGFAPCRSQDHEVLVRVMEGVEDIPGIVMAEGLDWNWETFPEFLDVLDAGSRDIDVAVYLPHNPLRVYVMGERGVRREVATDEDLVRMRAIAREAITAGALGFASTRSKYHNTSDKQPVPSYDTDFAEIEQIAMGVVDAGGGLLQFVPDSPEQGYRPVLAPMIEVSRRTGLPLTYSLATGYGPGSAAANEALEMGRLASLHGPRVTAQVFPRPIGLIFGLEASANPFTLCPSYVKIAELPLAERVALMRDPEVRRRMIAEVPVQGHMYTMMARNWAQMFPLAKEPDYEPAAAASVAARAKARGVTPEAEVYDLLLEDEGRAKLLVALGNYPDYRLDDVLKMFTHPNAVIGIGDGGAHYGLICDSSYPTFVLTHWVRDRKGERMTLQAAVKAMTSDQAQVVSLSDRGLLRPGYKAHINVIDLVGLRLHAPHVAHDLPGGGARLDQSADGYVATFVAGKCISRNGTPTGTYPGRLVRGPQAVPTQPMGAMAGRAEEASALHQ